MQKKSSEKAAKDSCVWMRLTKYTASDNERFRSKQNCEVIFLNLIEATFDRRRTYKFKKFYHFDEHQNGKRKNSSVGEATWRSCCGGFDWRRVGLWSRLVSLDVPSNVKFYCFLLRLFENNCKFLLFSKQTRCRCKIQRTFCRNDDELLLIANVCIRTIKTYSRPWEIESTKIN